MKSAKFNPVNPSESLGKWIDTLFNTTLADAIGNDYTVSSPSVNVSEHDSHFLVQVAAPGLTKQDFKISLENDQLIISAEKKTEQDESNGKFTRREFNYGSFKRSFHLDDSVNREGISAAYEDGVLKVTLPKKEDITKKPTSQSIEIR